MQGKCFLKLGIALLCLAYVMLLAIEYVSQGPKWWYRGAERTLRDTYHTIRKVANDFDEDLAVSTVVYTIFAGWIIYIIWVFVLS